MTATIHLLKHDRKNKTSKKCNYHGFLSIDEIYITDGGLQKCLPCKNNVPPIFKKMEKKSGIERFNLTEGMCNRCSTVKPVDEFYRNGAYRTLCHACEKTRRHEYRIRPEVRKRAYLYEMKRFYKKKYGMSFDQYDEILKRQNGLCAICRKPNSKVDARSKKLQRFHVDHCHETKKIRGLLCSKCNQGIGYFDENILVLEACIKYLTESKK